MLAVPVRVDLFIGVEDLGEVREVRLEGRLAGAAVAEMTRAAQGLEPPIRIDLSQLLSVDEEGLRALRDRRESGEELVGARPLIQHLLGRSPGEGVID